MENRPGPGSILPYRVDPVARQECEQGDRNHGTCFVMTDKTIDLDQHRGTVAQKATELRRLLAEVEADQRTLRLRQDELESQLVAAPAANWKEAAEKARYLLRLFAASLAGQDPRRQTLIAAVLNDFERLASDSQSASRLDRSGMRSNLLYLTHVHIGESVPGHAPAVGAKANSALRTRRSRRGT